MKPFMVAVLVELVAHGLNEDLYSALYTELVETYGLARSNQFDALTVKCGDTYYVKNNVPVDTLRAIFV